MSEGLSESDPQIFQNLLLCIDNSMSHVAFNMASIINFLPSAQAWAWQTKLKKLDRKQDGFLCSVFSSRHIPRTFTHAKVSIKHVLVKRLITTRSISTALNCESVFPPYHHIYGF